MLYSGASFDMMRPASPVEAGQYQYYPVVGFPSGQREQTVNLPSSTSKVRILPPPPSLSITSKFELPLVGFPSGQREQTVNLPSQTSKVRILPPPPSLSSHSKKPNTDSMLFARWRSAYRAYEYPPKILPVGRIRRSRHPAKPNKKPRRSGVLTALNAALATRAHHLILTR